MPQLSLWLAAGLLLVPVSSFLAFRTCRTFLRRLESERQHAQQLSELHLATIEALALTIDARDQTAHSHIRRVQIFSAALARAAGMSEEEVQAVTAAALLHDIGKLAVPEHILAKPGPLSPDELHQIRIHPQVGPAPDAPPAADIGPAVFDDSALAHQEIDALYQIAQTMGTSLSVTDTMTLLTSKLSNLVPFSACALFLCTESSDSLYCRFATGTDSERIQQLALKNGQGLAGWVARHRRPLVNGRPSAELEAPGSSLPTALQSALVCPLIVGDRLIGTLAAYHTTSGFYRDDHRRLLERICEQAAAVIHNGIVFEQTQEASLTDPLTGLPNTRFLFMHLTRELARGERLTSEVSLLVLDLNDFKDINDNFGHHIGDRALREVAQVLRAVIRPYDVCVRYAGDEFIVVLAGCGREEAENKKIELQQAIDAIVFEPRPGHRLPLSISAGAAVFPHDGDSYESLLAKGDARMYRDKSMRKQDIQRQSGTRAASRVDLESPAARP